jgi:ABC-type nickel/cobalt efflux system permease component RcnA
VKSYGALGVSLIVLSILGYVSTTILVIGFILVMLDAYTAYAYHKDLQKTNDALLTLVGLLWYYNSEEEMLEEEQDGL